VLKSLSLSLSLSVSLYAYTVELHLFGVIGPASQSDMQKIWITGFFFENRLHWQFEGGLLVTVGSIPASEPFGHS
jgi:hypothetical protein